MRADEQISATPAKNRDWWNDPLGVFGPDTRPRALKIHGFIIGTFLGPLGVVAVATFSSAEKRAHRLIGAGIGLAVWLPLCIALSAG
jgi:hypothetical protein